MDPVARLNFIPFVSSRRVREHYAIAQTMALPSYRHFHLARMLERESPLRVALRESNVITSTLHAPAENEGFFLFFTDGAVAPRPLLGALKPGRRSGPERARCAPASARRGPRPALGHERRDLQPSRAVLPEHPQGHERVRATRRPPAPGSRGRLIRAPLRRAGRGDAGQRAPVATLALADPLRRERSRARPAHDAAVADDPQVGLEALHVAGRGPPVVGHQPFAAERGR